MRCGGEKKKKKTITIQEVDGEKKEREITIQGFDR